MTVSGVWPVPGCLSVSAAPDSSEARSIPSSAQPQPARVLRRPGAGQPPSEAINLQSTESLRPSPPSGLRGQCPLSKQMSVHLDFKKSANYFITWHMKPSPDVRESRMSWAQEARGVQCTATYRNKIAFTLHISRQRQSSVSQLYLSQQRLVFAQSSFCNTVSISWLQIRWSHRSWISALQAGPCPPLLPLRGGARQQTEPALDTGLRPSKIE